MDENDIIEFLKKNVEPLEDKYYGNGYRCSATLTDGLDLPCMMFRPKKNRVDLAINGFDDLKGNNHESGISYKDIVSNFVTSGNNVNSYDIQRVDVSPFAMSMSLLNQIHGETRMSWTGFVLEMNDGAMFSYGTAYLFEFFELPDGYTFGDTAKVHNPSFLVDGVLKSYHDPEQFKSFSGKSVFRERPFFTCYLDDL